jgi:hypothetical protein
MREKSFLGALVLTFATMGCAADPPPPPAPPPAPVAEAPPAPRCSRDDASEPSDARGKMRALGEDVRRCFLLGSHKDPATSVEVELKIAESGAVTSASVFGADSNPPAVSCSQKALRQGTFGKFCGNDVTIRWKYTLASD